jgi:asparagine synthase (glutamine-hydrolysing)
MSAERAASEMCGLNGIYAYNVSANLPDRRELISTRDAMTARGPDGAGEWWSEDRRLGLGHRRLSIIDLSERASQPMVSACGRYVVVFNGEIYNYPALRRDLESKGSVFRTSADTEILLHLYELKGAQMVHDIRGMFAFAVWDNQKRSLFLARDPYGIKPLYTANDGWTFRFASQVKALLAGGKVSRDPEPAGIVGFHVWGSVPEPFTLYRDIRCLPAGHTQFVDEAGPREPKAYASIAQEFADGAAQPLARSEINDRVRTAALESVSAHLLADVEVGIFLSAGVDSGALLGLMRDAGQEKIRAITLAFEEFLGTQEDEAPLARKVAQHYGAEHIVRTVTEAEFRADLPLILEAMDQPSIDGINTWFISKAAREAGLKVALSGVGGDEILAGYPSFQDIPRWVSWLRVPAAVPGLGLAAAAILKATGLNRNNPKALGLLKYGGAYAGAYLLRRGLMLPDELNGVLDPDTLRIGLRRLKPVARIRQSMKPFPRSPLSRVAALESTNYMRNQLLRDTDWAGMAHSLEIRTPLVDTQLHRLLSSVTPGLVTGMGKRALANAPTRPLPASVVNRTKTGFGVPTGHWAGENSLGRGNKGLASRAWAGEVFKSSAAPAKEESDPKASLRVAAE